MKYRAREAVNEMIQQAIIEQINGIIADSCQNNGSAHSVLKNFRHEISGAGRRITYDAGRSKRLREIMSWKSSK